MFKNLRNEAKISFCLKTASPLIIKGGQEAGLNPLEPSMKLIRSSRDGVAVPFIPGASLKGVFRSRADQIVRALELPGDEMIGRHEKQKADQMKDMNGTERFYASDAVAQLFGSVMLAGRISFKDAFPVPGERLVVGERTHVGIDRVTGAANVKGGALYNPEIVEEGVFATEIAIVNYAVSQLQLIAYILQDLHEGYLSVGSMTTRGYGRLTIADVQVAVRDYRRNIEEETLYGYELADAVKIPGRNYIQKPFCHELQQTDLAWLLALPVDMRQGLLALQKGVTADAR